MFLRVHPKLVTQHVVPKFVGGCVALQRGMHLHAKHDPGSVGLSLVHAKQAIEGLEEQPQTQCTNDGKDIYLSVHRNLQRGARL